MSSFPSVFIIYIIQDTHMSTDSITITMVVSLHDITVNIHAHIECQPTLAKGHGAIPNIHILLDIHA